MAENKDSGFITVPVEFIEELTETARTSEWQRGYIQGVEDGINYATQILGSMQPERSE